MGGINDIRNAFSKMAPGIKLEGVKMQYDNATGEEVLTFDAVVDGKPQQIVERVKMGGGMTGLLQVAKRAAEAMGVKVTEVPPVPPVPTTEIAQKAAEGIAKFVDDLEPIGHPEPVKLSPQAAWGNPVVGDVEHKGEKYELAVDGHPQTLFF